MPLTGATSAAPSYSSTRVQKAYRLNGIESIRLQWRLQLLDRQKVRAVRLVNQDIRLTRVALEHIHISSGVSVDEHEIIVDTKSELAADGPMFLYGERQVSRKQGRARRIQSAVTDSGRRKTPSVDVTRRPQTAALPTTFADVRARAGTHFDVAPFADDDVDSDGERLSSATGTGITRGGFFHALDPSATRESGPHLPPSEGQIAAEDDSANRRRRMPRAKTAAGGRPTATTAGARPATAVKSPLPPSPPRPAGKEAAPSNAIHETATVAGLDRTVTRDAVSRPGNSLRNETAADSDRTASTPAAGVPAPPSPSLARPPSRAEQTAEAVKQARALSGRAKRFRNSVVSDPLLDKTLPIAEKKRKRKEALLQQRKNAQLVADLGVAEKVRKYLVQHPLSRAAVDGETSAGSDDDGDVFDEADSRRPAESRSRLGLTVELAPTR